MAANPPKRVSAAQPLSVAGQLQRHRRDWTSLATTLIGERLADARAHARLDATPTAHARVAALGIALRRHLSDARAAFYRRAVEYHATDVDPATESPVVANADDERILRESRAVGHGDQFAELDAAIDDVRRGLRLATALADRETQLSLWESQRRSILESLVEMHLNDSQVAIHDIIGRLKVRPEFR